MNIFAFINIILLFLILFGCLILIFSFIFSKAIFNKPKPINDVPSYCILIPARNESKVIRSPLKSLREQSVAINMKDVFVIVEDKDDKTCLIAKEYGANIFVRKNLNLARKGYAIDECVKFLISKNKYYDMCFIVDADNILDKDFIKNMVLSYKKGYDIGVSHRDSSNANESIVAGASTITFEMINSLNNFKSGKQNVTVTGTGFYIKGDYIFNKFKGYPFHSLTEDYELTLYSINNKLSSCYVSNAIIYDEQPILLKDSIMQRTRWIKGFLNSRKYNGKENLSLRSKLGIIPYLLIIIGVVFLDLSLFIDGIYNIFLGNDYLSYFVFGFFIIFLIYFILVVVTFIIMFINRNKITMSKFMKLKVLFYHPIFLFTYVICFIKAITNKNVKWDIINHHNKSNIIK